MGGLPRATPVWLFLRRLEDGQIKYAFSNAPAETPLAALCRAATLRWPIEQYFQDGKSQSAWITMSTAPGRPGTGTCCTCSWHSTSCCVCGTSLKKTPALTLPQARLLLAAVLLCRVLTPTHVLELVRYYTTRNYIAYRSHRKKRLALLPERR